jgi:hypothetical protein
MTRKAWIIVAGVIAAAAVAVAVTIALAHDGGSSRLVFGHGDAMRGFGFADRGFIDAGYDWSRAVPWLLLATLVGVGAALAVWQPWRTRPAVAAAAGAAPLAAQAQFDEWHRAAHSLSAAADGAPVAAAPSEWSTAQMAAAGHPAAPATQPMEAPKGEAEPAAEGEPAEGEPPAGRQTQAKPGEDG